MKKILSLLLGACLALSGCAQNAASAPSTDTAEAGEKISVVSTIFAPYDFVRQIAGALAEVTMLLPPGTESHSYELTPQDIIKIQNCDIFVYVGGDSDAWIHEVLESMDTGKMKIITLMDCVEVVEEEIVEGMENDHDDDHHGHDEDHAQEYDEHVWTSPRNAKNIVSKLSDALCGTDPANAVAYKANAEAYKTLLDALDARFRAVVDGAARRTLIFGDRFPFRYLADAYGLEYYAAFPGCSTETEASAATVAFLIDKARAEGIPVVFHVELSNKKMANTIGEETGAQVLLLHACHNVTRDEMADGITYLELMNQNVENLKEALK